MGEEPFLFFEMGYLSQIKEVIGREHYYRNLLKNG
jgi:hypothetical protein